MNTQTIQQTIHLPVPPAEAYAIYLDPVRHEAFTGMKTAIDPEPGGTFTHGEDDMITGRQLELEPGRRIVQDWTIKMEGWPAGHQSRLALDFLPDGDDGCRVEMTHAGVPAVCATPVAGGWHEYYWQPLTKYLATNANVPALA